MSENIKAFANIFITSILGDTSPYTDCPRVRPKEHLLYFVSDMVMLCTLLVYVLIVLNCFFLTPMLENFVP